jgi:hypothetical protein
MTRVFWVALGILIGLVIANTIPLPHNAAAAPRRAPEVTTRSGNWATLAPAESGSVDQGLPGAPSDALEPMPVLKLDGYSSPPPVTTGSGAPLTLGIASWYPAAGLQGAMPSYRFGDDPFPVAVCAFEGGRSACVTVLVTSFCLCRVGASDRVIDLSPEAFAVLAPLSRGLVRVQLEVLDR